MCHILGIIYIRVTLKITDQEFGGFQPHPHGPSQRLQEMAEMAVRGSQRIFLGAGVITLVTVRGWFGIVYGCPLRQKWHL